MNLVPKRLMQVLTPGAHRNQHSKLLLRLDFGADHLAHRSVALNLVAALRAACPIVGLSIVLRKARVVGSRDHGDRKESEQHAVQLHPGRTRGSRGRERDRKALQP